MKLSEVVGHYLRDVSNNSGSKYTLPTYRRSLAVLLRLLSERCQVVELEQVTVLSLRQCVEVLLTTWVTGGPRDDKPRNRWGRLPEDDEKLSVSSVRYYIRIWKAFFNWCYREELLDKNPVARLSLPRPETKVQPVVSVEQMELMLAACDRSTAEVGKLLWKYIHKYRKPVDESEEALFLGRKGPLTVGGVSQVIGRAKRLAGLNGERISAHAFRRAFAMLYLEQGGDLFKLSREMGHSDVQITKIYLENFDSRQARKDHPAFSPVSLLKLNKRKGKRKES